jgi:hypothetical protein
MRSFSFKEIPVTIRSRVLFVACSLGPLATVGVLGPQPALADPRADREAITALIYCYAQGTDAIGDATTNADPLEKGARIYHQCLADDVEVRGWFPQRPFDSQAFPDPNAHPDSAPPAYHGPRAWAQHVNSVFRAKGYNFTQHSLSNVQVTVDGHRGTLTAYLNATLVISGAALGASSRCVTASNGTYSASVERRGVGWRITRLYLTLLTFNPIFQSGKGC